MLLPYGTDTYLRGCRCVRARMVIGFITTYAISGFLRIVRFSPPIKLTATI